MEYVEGKEITVAFIQRIVESFVMQIRLYIGEFRRRTFIHTCPLDDSVLDPISGNLLRLLLHRHLPVLLLVEASSFQWTA